MDVYIGLDVSLASTASCVIGEKGKIITEAQIASTPDALVAFMGKLEHEIAAIGLEAGPLVNHAPASDITEHYAADWTVAQLREPAQRIADRIEALMNGAAPEAKTP